LFFHKLTLSPGSYFIKGRLGSLSAYHVQNMNLISQQNNAVTY